MKSLLLLFITFLFLSITILAQEGWVQQTSGTSENLTDVYFINQDTGWVVGSAGTLLFTENRGASWSSLEIGTTSDLWGILFTNAYYGTIIGGDGTILRTEDAGFSWNPQNSNTTSNLYGISFTDDNTGIVVGANGTILKTEDGGYNWFDLSSGTTTTYNSVFFTDANNGMMTDHQRIFRTTNGGTTWTQVYDLGYGLHQITRIFLLDTNIATAVCCQWDEHSGSIIRTNDAGTTWFYQSGEHRFLYDVHYADINNGTVVGSNGKILKTTDSGASWFVQSSGTSHTLRDVFFIDEDNGWVVGDYGTILHTTNGGGVVPVELTSFIAQAENQKVILKWATATELNNNGFEVQRKTAESDFATVGFVKGEGTTINQKEYSYIDRDLVDGKYFYRLKQVDYNGTFEYSNVIEVDVRSLNEYALEQNYPNPFNPATTIGYVLKEKANANLIILNAIGEAIAVLVNEEQDKGYHKVEFDASILPSGVYFCRFQVIDPESSSGQDFIETKKMILLK